MISQGILQKSRYLSSLQRHLLLYCLVPTPALKPKQHPGNMLPLLSELSTRIINHNSPNDQLIYKQSPQNCHNIIIVVLFQAHSPLPLNGLRNSSLSQNHRRLREIIHGRGQV